MTPGGIRVVFMGSPAFAVPSLKALVEAGYNVVGVVTQPDRPAGRGAALKPPEVKVAATAIGLDVIQPESLKDANVQQKLRDLQPNVVVVAAYGKILPRAVLETPSRGSLNVHASLLPRWRGASPIAAAILAGDRETGVSIMELVQKMDAGPVVLRKAIALEPGDTTGTLEPRLANLGAEALIEALPRWYQREIPPGAQDEGLATYCRTLNKEDGHLRADMTSQEAERAVRAYNPWPVAFVMYEGQRLAIWRAHLPATNVLPREPSHLQPGAMLVIERAPAVMFEDGPLVLDEVQREGGKRLSGRDFLNGLRGKLAERVGLA